MSVTSPSTLSIQISIVEKQFVILTYRQINISTLYSPKSQSIRAENDEIGYA
jgi:hypothetical protein